MTSAVQAIGIAWYKEADYQRLKLMFADGHKLPLSFLQWQDQAEQLRKRYVRQGYVVVKAHIDPEQFPAWCTARSLNIDANARMEFANAEARRIVVESQKHD
ncbi:hypothetical protein [Pandoraea sputorum]|uniref:hypothetical protein n=1 Tax=Pandoraea sputorum TaxID=93222 RepID=UPI0012403F57|nr:hypothetical protein [Pandoraea sputorum]VVE07073.1 hypothetical protein PSP20601_02450 [Pandoraea sputorum]